MPSSSLPGCRDQVTLEGFIMGFGDILLEGPAFAPVRPKVCLLGPGEEAK